MAVCDMLDGDVHYNKLGRRISMVVSSVRHSIVNRQSMMIQPIVFLCTVQLGLGPTRQELRLLEHDFRKEGIIYMAGRDDLPPTLAEKSSGCHQETTNLGKNCPKRIVAAFAPASYFS